MMRRSVGRARPAGSKRRPVRFREVTAAKPKEIIMINVSDIQEHAEIIGKDGRHVGTVDRIEGSRIKLTRVDSQGAEHAGHHHFIALDLVETVQDNRVHLSVPGSEAIGDEQEQNGRAVH
jgi:hypothetical protein